MDTTLGKYEPPVQKQAYAPRHTEGECNNTRRNEQKPKGKKNEDRKKEKNTNDNAEQLVET